MTTDLLDKSKYIGGTDKPLADTPCRPDEHDFGDAVLGKDGAKTTPCTYCGYTVAAIRDMPGQIFPHNSLDFECDICGELTDSADGQWRYEHEWDTKVCDECWNSEYYPHIDMCTDEFDHHVLTCSNFLTSTNYGIYPDGVEFEADCQWIARLNAETITHYLQETPDEGMPSDAVRKPGVACPSCGQDHATFLRVVDLTESVASQAIMETLAPESVDHPHAAPIFGNDPNSVSRILTDDTHDELLNIYHRLEQKEN
jgi:hypothetical protein